MYKLLGVKELEFDVVSIAGNDQRRLIAGGGPEGIVVATVAPKIEIQCTHRTKFSVSSVYWLSEHLYAGDTSGKLHIFTFADGALTELHVHSVFIKESISCIYSCSTRNHDAVLCLGSGEGSVSYYNISNDVKITDETLISTLKEAADYISVFLHLDVRVHPLVNLKAPIDFNAIVAGSGDGSFYVFNADKQLIHLENISNSAGGDLVSAVSAGGLIGAVDVEGSLQVWNAAGGRWGGADDEIAKEKVGEVTAVCLNKGLVANYTILAASSDGQIRPACLRPHKVGDSIVPIAYGASGKPLCPQQIVTVDGIIVCRCEPADEIVSYGPLEAGDARPAPRAGKRVKKTQKTVERESFFAGL